MGLFVETKNKVHVQSSCSAEDKSSSGLREALACAARRRILSRENNEGLLGEASPKGVDFTYALSWLLAQDVYSLPTGSWQEIEAFESLQLSSLKRAFANSTRWDGFRDWSLFLGFAWQGAGRLSLDPSVALRDELPAIFEDSRELPTARFAQRASAVLPVLDGGDFRRDVEGVIRPGSSRELGEHELSPSLSRALMRLERSGLVELSQRADSPDSRSLLGREFRALREVSHVTCRERPG